MPPPPAPRRPLRRLLSALLALGVLLTTLGWGHPSCDEAGAHAASGPHAAMDAAHDSAHDGHGATPRGPADCPDHNRHGERDATACAPLAHCTVGVAAMAVVVPTSQVLRVVPAVELTSSRPLDASYPPDSPPPKT